MFPKDFGWFAASSDPLPGSATSVRPVSVDRRYSHYDVVAAGKGWSTDPWKMVAIDGYFYGRGVSDNKGICQAEPFEGKKEVVSISVILFSRWFVPICCAKRDECAQGALPAA